MAGKEGKRGKYKATGLEKLNQPTHMKELFFLVVAGYPTIRNIKKYYTYKRQNKEAFSYTGFHHNKEELAKIKVNKKPLITFTGGHKGKDVVLSCDDSLIFDFIMHYAITDIRQLYQNLIDCANNLHNVVDKVKDNLLTPSFAEIGEKCRKNLIKTEKALKKANGELKIRLRDKVASLNGEYAGFRRTYFFNKVFKSEIEDKIKQAETLKNAFTPSKFTAPLLHRGVAYAFRKYIRALLYANQYQQDIVEIVRCFIHCLGDRDYSLSIFISNNKEANMQLGELRNLASWYKELYNFRPQNLFLKMPLYNRELQEAYEEHERQESEEASKRGLPDDW